MEEWIDIEDYEGLYQVSNYGRVKSLERTIIRSDGITLHYKEKIRKQTPNNSGYLTVIFSKNGVEEKKYIHDLVAQAFIPNPNNYEHVHHKNHDKTDNRIENLEWIDGSEHRAMHQSDRVEACIKALSKAVYQLQDDEIVNIWKSAHEVERQLGFKQSAISACCNGKQKTAYGYGWSHTPINV